MNLELIENNIPIHWQEINLMDFCNPKQWKTISTSQLIESGYVVYGANGKIGFYSEYTHEKPTLMITCRGATCGNLHISDPFSYINGNAMALDELSDQVLQKYLFYALKSRGLEDAISGSAQPQITRQGLADVKVPISPLAEQQQIAVKLDELLAQVDTLKTRLDIIPKILKRFRQSVLAAAVSGKLTEDWREGRNNDSSWQQQKLEDVCLSISDGDHQAPPRAKSGIPFLVISNISKGKLDFENVERWVPEDYYQSLKAVRIPNKNDILYTVTGSFGIPVIVDTNQSFCFQRHIAIIKPNHEVVNFKFVQIILGSIQGLKQAESVATGTAQKTVSLYGLRNFVFDFPSYEEQTEIVNRVKQLFTYADQIEQRVKDAQARVNHLTQAILAKAFRGELTADWREQNPDIISGENSAEALLARIKAERHGLEHNKVTNRRIIRKSGENMKPKGILPIIEALKAAGQPLSSQDLLVQSGYPSDAGTEQLEAFFLDIRGQLNANAITRYRQGDQEFFAIAE